MRFSKTSSVALQVDIIWESVQLQHQVVVIQSGDMATARTVVLPLEPTRTTAPLNRPSLRFNPRSHHSSSNMRLLHLEERRMSTLNKRTHLNLKRSLPILSEADTRTGLTVELVGKITPQD